MVGYIHTITIDRPLPADAYFTHLPAVKALVDHPLTLTTPVTFLVGENGMGKSTLTEAIAVAFGLNPEGGSRNFRFTTNASHSGLHQYLGIRKTAYPKDSFFLRAESFYNVASHIDALDKQPAAAPPIIEAYGGLSLHRQSHGESFLSLVQNRLGGEGMYIWDEPEAALSPMRLMTLLCEMKRLVEGNSQLIIATHSPILMAFPGAEILELSADGIRSVSLEQTEHYQVTKQFISDPQRMLHYLLEK
jgi:predicted ATPase